MAHGPALTVLLTADQVSDKVRERAAALNTGLSGGVGPARGVGPQRGFICLADLAILDQNDEHVAE